MSLVIVFFSIVLLLVLMPVLDVNAFISLILVAFAAGVAEEMPLTKTCGSVTRDWHR